ncbi:MAG: hypothetical protein DRJ61_18720 [Acidobacteria bacterium]|nr:MAG: hypothetical protein DRJ61_18720 [Acidobacteriota bacterium]
MKEVIVNSGQQSKNSIKILESKIVIGLEAWVILNITWMILLINWMSSLVSLRLFLIKLEQLFFLMVRLQVSKDHLTISFGKNFGNP